VCSSLIEHVPGGAKPSLSSPRLKAKN
jgi:hypothetical protein